MRSPEHKAPCLASQSGLAGRVPSDCSLSGCGGNLVILSSVLGEEKVLWTARAPDSSYRQGPDHRVPRCQVWLEILSA